ncbi:FtsX-like permease family protein [Vitiosangium sp. GDMCC 1.1324]|uniref:ABC transporter permease n=1 Tax=Vitiosangium sp. (strain GDMCC 1.1324) TaxID=2138576 RepID=UPI000D349003|nr:FtsX-like permease family protein [Vitiosangium sp. GDMCC 1.1324]PTL80524.1 ABC transporter permease [Vitiosangium sp. GDMCC 1.1324]
MQQLLLIAIRNLGTHKRRTLLLGGAIAGVTALLVILMGLSNGMKQTMLESATTLMTGHVNVAGFYKVTAGQSAPVVTSYPKLLEQLRQEVPELDYSVQRSRGWVKLVSESGSVQSGVGGIDVEAESGIRKVLQVRSGKLDDLAQPNTILLFEEQAKKLEVKVGDTITLSAPTMRGTSNTVDVRVAAIAANVGMLSSFNVFVPNSTLRGLYQLREDATGALMLYLKDMASIPAVQARLTKRLPELGYQMMEHNPQPFFMKFDAVNREAWTGQKLDITNWEDEISFIKWTVSALDALTGILTFVLLIIIAVGIMNTLWIAIRERTREIGTLRAIGMQRWYVLVMFLLEALVLGLLGTAVGAAAGLGVCLAVNALNLSVPVAVQVFILSEKLHLVVNPGSVMGAVTFITLCTTAISLVPSFLAARMKPVTAMHHIG